MNAITRYNSTKSLKEGENGVAPGFLKPVGMLRRWDKEVMRAGIAVVWLASWHPNTV